MIILKTIDISFPEDHSAFIMALPWVMIPPDNELSIIDFNRWDFGDPWEEFNRIVWSAAVSPHFCNRSDPGYFGGEPPIEFFKLLAFYISSNTIS